MICIPRELMPSSLLWVDELCQSAQDLRDNCLRFDQDSDPRLLEVWAKDSQELVKRGNQNCCAVIQVYLADLYRELERPGQALQYSRRAVQCFRPWVEIRHLHNRAVALYSLGLVHQLLGSEWQALTRYDEALNEFRKAREQWVKCCNEIERKKCVNAKYWIEQLREYLADVRADGSTPDRDQKLVPIVSRIAAGTPIKADEDFEDWIKIDEPMARRVNFALRVKGDSMIEEGIADGDRVLIEQTPDEPTGPGQIVAAYIDQVDTEATLKRFYREQDHVRLEPANANEPFIIVHPWDTSKENLKKCYAQSHPGRKLEFYQGNEHAIAGWYRGII